MLGGGGPLQGGGPLFQHIRQLDAVIQYHATALGVASEERERCHQQLIAMGEMGEREGQKE